MMVKVPVRAMFFLCPLEVSRGAFWSPKFVDLIWGCQAVQPAGPFWIATGIWKLPVGPFWNPKLVDLIRGRQAVQPVGPFWLDKVCIDQLNIAMKLYAPTFWSDKVCIDQLNIADGRGLLTLPTRYFG